MAAPSISRSMHCDIICPDTIRGGTLIGHRRERPSSASRTRWAAMFAPNTRALGPTMDQIRARAITILPRTSALDALCERALAIIIAAEATHGDTLVECQSPRGAHVSRSVIASSRRSPGRSVRMCERP